MSSRGRKSRISQSDQDNLDQALALMKSRKTGGTKTKYRHCSMILEYRKAVAELGLNPKNPQLIAQHDKTLSEIGDDIASLTAWVSETISVKTLNNYRSADPIRYVPTRFKSLPASVRKGMQDELSGFANYQEFQPERKKREPTSLRGILAQKAREKKRGT